ncbi:MAG: DUF5110 domain-containing protein [Bacteriovoracia bacterium]
MILENPGLATTVRMNGTQIKNEDFEVSVNPENLCVTVVDLKQSWDLVTTCPHNLSQPWKGLAVYTNDKLNAYGLGAYYQNPGSADGDWVGHVWDPGMNTLGNALRGFSGGAQSYAMFPVLYVQGSGTRMMKELSERSNISGKMFDGSYNHDLLVTIFPSNNKSSFTLIEDDGQTVDYKNQRLSETVISQHQAGNKIEIMLAQTAGDYDFMPGSREYQLAVYVNKDVKAVKLNGKEIEFKLQNGILKTNLGVHSQRSEKNVEIELK